MKSRINVAYLILGCALIVEFAVAFYNSGTVEGLNRRADNLKAYAIAERDDNTVLPGNIYDRQGETIVETQINTEGKKKYIETNYVGGKLYSQIVGYTGSRVLNPLAKEGEAVVGKRKDYRLMRMLDSDVWEKSGLYTTVNEDGARGHHVYLTTDNDLQEAVYQAMLKQMSDSRDQGSAVVLDAKTGEILSMVAFPSYDFNDKQNAIHQMMTDATEEKTKKLEPSFPVTYKSPKAPGSIFKVLMAVALIDHDMKDFRVKNESFEVNGWTCKASGYWSKSLEVELGDDINLEHALNISSNPFFAKAALELGPDAIRETAEKFMLVENTTEDGKNTIRGKSISLDLGDVEVNWDLNVTEDVLAQTGFGQGRTGLTTLHAAMITQAIANDGKLMQPHIIKAIYDADGKVAYEMTKSQVLSKATSKSTAKRVAKYMRSTAVECCNHYKLRNEKEIFDKYQVAGKTGTAELGRAAEENNNAWYISFAPVDDPKYVVVVNHCGVDKAGYKVIPIVADIYTYLFEQYQ